MIYVADSFEIQVYDRLELVIHAYDWLRFVTHAYGMHTIGLNP